MAMERRISQKNCSSEERGAPEFSNLKSAFLHARTESRLVTLFGIIEDE